MINLINLAAGGTIANGAVTTAKIADNAVTGAKIAMGSDAQGDILYFNGTDYVRLAAGTAGYVLTSGGAGANPSWANVPIIGKHKAADESVTTNASPQSDDDFLFSIGANETWVFTITMGVTSGASGGFKWLFTLPAGAAGRARVLLENLIAMDIDITAGSGTTTTFTSGDSRGIISGYIANSSTAGTAQFKWSQNASNGTATIVKRGATMIAARVA